MVLGLEGVNTGEGWGGVRQQHYLGLLCLFGQGRAGGFRDPEREELGSQGHLGPSWPSSWSQEHEKSFRATLVGLGSPKGESPNFGR